MSELWNLPATWCWTHIGDVTDVIGGGTPSTTNPKNFDGAIPWITPADMSGYSDKTISGGARFISEKALENSGARWLPQGTVLFSSRAPIGYVAIASRPVTTNQGFKSFVPGNGLNSDYLYYWLTSAKQHAEALASGTTFLELSGAKAALIPLPLAPQPEQTRIVAKLEELLTDLDAGVAELKAAQKKLGQYRQSLLKAAVEGALTAQWRAQQTSTETGAQLRERILEERRTLWEAKQLAKFKEQGKTPPKDWQKKYPEPVQPDTSSLPELPEGWVWSSLDVVIADGPQNGVYLPGDRYGFGTPILRIDDYQIGWHRDRAELNLVDADDATCKTYSLANGDLVINRVNSMTHLGKSLLVTELLNGVLFESNMMRSCLSPLVSGEFFAFYLGSDVGRARLTRDAKWAVNQASINQQDVRRTPVPIAPANEQIAIAAILKEQLDSVDQQRVAIDQSLKQSNAQRQNILRAAFAGQLVPQNPNDEPASGLLERIRAERAERAKLPKVHKTKQHKEIAAVMSKLIDVLADAGDWLPAQEAFRRCGVADGAETDQIEVLYAELRALDKAGRLAVEAVTDAQGRKLNDRLKLLAD